MTFEEVYEKLKQENSPLLSKPCKTMYEIPFPPYYHFESFDSIENAIESCSLKCRKAECEICEKEHLVFALEFPKKIPKTY